MENKDYGIMLQQMTEDQRKQQQHIDTLTAQMKPLAQTSNGQFALQDKMADQSAPKEERAAAAQALAPGFVASVGKHGELSFSAAPMQDLGTPAGQSFEQGRVQSQVDAGKTSTFMQNFDSVYTDIMQEKDPLKITEKSANLNAELANVINSKEAGVRSRLVQSLGINNLEAQIQQSTDTDKRLYAANGMSYSGPTSETWQLINQRDQMTARMDAMVADEVSKDPEIANIKTRMVALDTLIKQKQTIAGQIMAGKTNEVGASVNPQSIAKVRQVMGVADTPEANAEIAKNLMANNPRYVKAEQLAEASPEYLIATSVAGGVDGQNADRVLATKFEDPKDVALIKERVRNFDIATVPEKERGQFELSIADRTLSPERQAQAKQQIEALKVAYVIKGIKEEQYQKLELGANALGQPGGWSIPTDPLLAEIPQVVQDIKKDDPKTVVTAELLIRRMHWDKETRAAKIEALSNYMYAQAQANQGLVTLGGVSGYRSPQEVKLRVQTKVAAETARAAQSRMYMEYGRGGI